jgi:TRAP transporter TAXI family solute receptor
MGIVVHKDSPLTSLREVKQRRLAVRIGSQPPGSLSEFGTRQVLEAYGLTADEIRSYGGTIVATDLGVVADQFKDRKLDMIISLWTPGHPTFSELSITPGLRFLDLDSEALALLKNKYGYQEGTMPPGTFTGQDRPVRLVTFPTGLYAHRSLPEPVAYTVTKALVENMERLRTQFKSMAVLTRESAVKPENLIAPLHPGAERYYREAGMIR